MGSIYSLGGASLALPDSGPLKSHEEMDTLKEEYKMNSFLFQN